MTDLPKLRDGSEWGGDGEVLFGSSSVLGCAHQDDDEGAVVYMVIDSDESSERDCEAYASDVLALLDANGLNTTADALRETRQRKAMSIKKTLETLLELLDAGDGE